MSDVLEQAAALAVVALLACFAARRTLLLAAAVAPGRRAPVGVADPPSLTLVVPACNEAAGIDRTLAALTALHYPAQRLFVVLVNDASDDDTGARLARWARGRPRALALDLRERGGRARALNEGIAAAPAGDLVAVCDADVRPRPDYLVRLVAAFADESVGAATGLLAPENPGASPIARYAAVESWVNQLVTSAGKDRLDLNPPTLGAAVYRRAALEQVGGFGPGPSGDDVRSTVALTRAGWRTRFDPRAVADTAVVSRWGDYWRQHVRWARDLFSLGARVRPTPTRAGHARRAELVMLSTGYADRIVLLAGLGLAASGRLAPWIPAGYLGLAGAEVVTAGLKASAPRRLPVHLLWTVPFFVVDVIASLAAAAAQLARRPRGLHSPARAGAPLAGAGDRS